ASHRLRRLVLRRAAARARGALCRGGDRRLGGAGRAATAACRLRMLGTATADRVRRAGRLLAQRTGRIPVSAVADGSSPAGAGERPGRHPPAPAGRAAGGGGPVAEQATG